MHKTSLLAQSSGEYCKYSMGQKKRPSRVRKWTDLDEILNIVSQVLGAGWPWRILGAIRAVETVWEGAEIFFFLVRYI